MASAIGPTFTVDLLGEACDLGSASVLDALDEALAAGLVREMAEGFALRPRPRARNRQRVAVAGAATPPAPSVRAGVRGPAGGG